MKISRLYIKYFLTVIAIVLASHLLTMQLFRLASSMNENSNLMNDFSGLAFLLSDSVKVRIDDRTASEKEMKEKLSAFLKDVGDKWSVDIWVESSDGRTVAAGVSKRRPEFGRLPVTKDLFRIASFERRSRNMRMIVPVDTTKGKMNAYVVLHRDKKRDYLFFGGLAGISVLVLLVMFPLSRKITNPLNRLTESANAISRGEFNLHVDESPSDEIGTLARAFNRMRGQILLMINGTKELTANVSHQIRSPLARMNVAVEILRRKIEKGDNAGALSSLETIERETDEIDTLTGRIIDLIRTDIAHRSDDYEMTDLRDTVAEVTSRNGAKIASRGGVFAVNVPDEPVNVRGIAREIAELTDILVGNACAYVPENGTVRIDVENTDNSARLIVANASRGINEDEAERVFKPFARGRDEKTQGYGLGLAIAKRIVENHGGRIYVEPSRNEFRVVVELNRG